MKRSVGVAGEGIAGELYLPREQSAPVCVVVVAGFSGGFSHRPTAQALARDGFAAFALAHFAADGLPPRMENIPLEYVARAAGWLRDQPELRDHRLVMMGTSRGAELALQVAARFPLFAGAILTSPSHVRWPAPGGRAAAWAFGGSPLPHVEPRAVEMPDPVLRVVDGKAYRANRDTAPIQLRHNPSVEAATIEAETMRGPLLMFAGRDDDLWPSELFADAIEARLTHRGFSHRVDNVQYERVGHNIPLPGERPLLRVIYPGAAQGLSFGGEADATAAAAEDRWRRIAGFLGALGEGVT